MIRITAIICLAETLGMAGFAAFPTLLPQFFAEWNITNTEAGWINGIYYAGYVLAVIILTSLTDRAAPRDIYLFSTAISGLSCIGFAFWADGFWSAMAFRTLGGIGLAGTYMPGLKMLNDFLSGPKKSRAVAFYTSSFGIGTSFSIVATGYMADVTDWHTTFALLTLGPIAAIILTVFMVPRIKTSDTARTTHVLDFRPVLRCRAAMAYVVGYTIHNFELFAYRAWTVAFLVYAVSLHEGTALPLSIITLAAIINLFGVPASIIGNEFALKVGRHRWIIMVMILSAMLASLIGYTASWSLWLVIGLCCLYSATITADSAALTAGAVEAAPPGYLGATMAMYSSIAFTGAFLGPLVFGIVLDFNSDGGAANASDASDASWGTAFVVVGIVSLMGPVLMRWIGEAKDSP